MERLTIKEGKELILLVRKVIEIELFGSSNKSPKLEAPIFFEKRGVFVTIHINGVLRGCIGTIEAINPIIEAVNKMAYSSAFNDPRFSPLSKDEYSDVDIEISIMSEPKEGKPEDIVIGRHGIIISHKYNKGLLLPQVAIENNWDKYAFLNYTCLKASLPKDMWKRGAEIELFEAEVFTEKD